MLPHDTRWSDVPASRLTPIYGPRVSRVLRTNDIEGIITDSDVRADLRRGHVRRTDPRLDSRPFSAREIATRPSKKPKRSRNGKLIRRIGPEPRGRYIVATYPGAPVVLRPDGSIFRRFQTMRAAKAEAERQNA